MSVLLVSLLQLTVMVTGYRDEGAPSRITCFTCDNATTNDGCNNLAVDRACPSTQQFCHTLHVMGVAMLGVASSLGGTYGVVGGLKPNQSVGVIKKCAKEAECKGQTGCRTLQATKVCISCCDTSYCNEGVPWTLEESQHLVTSGRTITTCHSRPATLTVILLLLHRLIITVVNST